MTSSIGASYFKTADFLRPGLHADANHTRLVEDIVDQCPQKIWTLVGSYLNENAVFAMKNLITTAYEKTGKQVVVLIDHCIASSCLTK